jgi:hypothetical protein
VWERPEGAPAGWKVPRDEVDAIADAMERFQVLELACDPPGWVAELDHWRETYGDVVVDFPTNERRRMAPACDRLRTAVLDGDAPDSPRTIDAAVAAVIAHDRACWHAANGPSIDPEVLVELVRWA